MVIKTVLNLKLYHPTCKAYEILQSHVDDTVLISHSFIESCVTQHILNMLTIMAE